MSSNSNVLPSLFSEAFNNPRPEHFWHFLMKHRHSGNTYLSETVDQRIREIIQKQGSNSFTSQGVHGWTPAHVAVLMGNVAGLEFLEKRNALAKEIKDADGMTPAQLAARHHPELVRFFEPATPAVPQGASTIAESIATVFKAKHVSLPNDPYHYRENSADFGLVIQTLLLPKPSNVQDAASNELERVKGVKMAHFAENLKSLGQKFGFQVQFSPSIYCPRDNLIRLPGGGVLIPNTSKNIQAALDCCDSRTLVLGDHASKKTDHDSFQGGLGAADAHAGKAADDLVALFGMNPNQLPELRFYMEGGNAYLVSCASGKNILLMGQDTLYIALNQMREDKVFEDRHLDMAGVAEHYRKSLLADPALLKKSVEEMHAQGLLGNGNGRKGLVTRKEIVNELRDCRSRSGGSTSDKRPTLLEQAIERKLYSPPDLTDQNIQRLLPKVAEYLAQKEMTKTIIALSFSVNFTDVHFIPQCDYHLDVFARPGPKGSLFLQDYGFTLALLREIEANQEKLGLTTSDRALLQRYITTAAQLEKELAPLFQETCARLKRAGLKVIPTPGVFYDVSSHILNPSASQGLPTFNLNFINSLSGWSPTTQSYYYIASGAKCGDKLGKILMDAFRQFIHSYQPDTQVCFIGHHPGNPDDFSEAMQWMNVPGLQLGPHCLSFETKTAAHRE